MIATLNFRIDCSSSQKASALRDKLAAQLADDPDVQVIASTTARETQDYEVLAVDLATEEVTTETVEATSEEDAREKAEVVGKVIAEVRSTTPGA